MRHPGELRRRQRRAGAGFWEVDGYDKGDRLRLLQDLQQDHRRHYHTASAARRRPLRRHRGPDPGHGAGGQLRHRRAGGGLQRRLGQRQQQQLPLRRRGPGDRAPTPAGGDDIGWTGTGQWFKYTVNVATAGTYTVSLRLASPSAVTDGLHIANSSGTNLSGNINVPKTGGWQAWTTVTANVTLPGRAADADH